MASFRLPYWSAWPIHSTPHVSRFFCCLPCCPRLLSRCLSLLREPGTTALRCLDLALPPSSALSTFLPLVHTLVRPAATLPIAACASVNMVTFSGGIISKIRLCTVCNRLAAWRVTLCGAADERYVHTGRPGVQRALMCRRGCMRRDWGLECRLRKSVC